MSRAPAALSVAALVLSAAPASAQIDVGREALAGAEFARAIEAFDEAERGALDRDAYISLLEGRAIAAWASGDEGRTRADLAALAEIDPQHAFPNEAPPDVTALFTASVAAYAGPLAVTAVFDRSGDGVTATVRNDGAELVASVRAHIRSRGGRWSVAEADPPRATFDVAHAPDAGAEAWIELIGPGGAVLATAGTEAEPIRWQPAGGAPERDLLDASSSDDDSSTGLWVGLGVGGGLAIAAAIVILAVVLTGGGGAEGAQPGPPMVMGF